MKTMNLLIFVLLFNGMCGVVASLPDNAIDPVNNNQNLFTYGETQIDTPVYSFEEYNITNQTAMGEDDFETSHGKSITESRSIWNKLGRAFFGLPSLLEQALGAESTSVRMVGTILRVALSLMYGLMLLWIIRGTVID